MENSVKKENIQEENMHEDIQKQNVQRAEEVNIDEIINMLDNFASSDVSRLKIDTSEDVAQGEVKKQYHHGRCDVGSPWARGCSFDVLEDEEE